jgi:hypothetical protein
MKGILFSLVLVLFGMLGTGGNAHASYVTYYTGQNTWSNIGCPWMSCGGSVTCSQTASYYPASNTLQAYSPQGNPCRTNFVGTDPFANWGWYWYGCTGQGTSQMTCGGNLYATEYGDYNCYQFRVTFTAWSGAGYVTTSTAMYGPQYKLVDAHSLHEG